MIDWSISKSKLFTKCQRKWYYQTIVASPTSNDPLRKQAYQLKNFKVYPLGVEASLTALSTFYSSSDQKAHRSIRGVGIGIRKGLMDKQIAFGKDKKHLCGDVSKSSSEIIVRFLT
jgi:hypothetical protein